MQIEFVNHSSYIVSANNIKLITDPWIDGYAFYNGWSLITPTKFSYPDFKRITHIWFSHEHPDHFSPPNINSIPLEYRQKITVLYQHTKDKKVVDFCRNADFKQVIELKAEWVDLAAGFSLYNKPHTDGDSWLAIKAGDKTLLNLNDCVFDTIAELAVVKKVCPVVDVLFTQFSYAAWVGNVGDIDAQKRQATRKVKEIKRQADILNPSYIIPFASFVWFCNTDNFYLNEGVNKIPDVYNFIKENTNATPVILFTADRWQVGEAYDSTQAINNWVDAYSIALSGKAVTANKEVSSAELIASGKKYAAGLVKNNSLFIRMLKPAKIYVTDLKQAYKLSLNGLETANYDYDSCDIALSADALLYCFKFNWGGSTIRVNGRYQVPKNGKFYNIKMYFQVAQLNNFNQSFNLWYIGGVILQKIKAKLFN